MCGEHFCSMKTTQELRQLAGKESILSKEELDIKLKHKAEEFRKSGSEVYK
jgi:phosphomethylpyrimidine synthase